jgi:hypothetical protein
MLPKAATMGDPKTLHEETEAASTQVA